MEITIKKIEGIPHYYIDNKGMVWSDKPSPRYNPNGEMRILRPRNHPSGYLYVGLYIGNGGNKQRLWRRVHRLVAEAFLGNIPNGWEVDHKNGIKTDNRLENLRIVTHRENMIEAAKRRKQNEKV
jgi:hypothetical protein